MSHHRDLGWLVRILGELQLEHCSTQLQGGGLSTISLSLTLVEAGETAVLVLIYLFFLSDKTAM